MVATLGAPCNIPNYTPRRGIFVYGDAGDGWVPTRRVWTSHTYHVTNATAQANAPVVEQNNWELDGLNNYRQNVQGNGVFNAPDLAVDLALGLEQCDAQLELIATVKNKGALGVEPGVEVRFYEGVDATGVLLATYMTEVPLLPGQSTKIVHVVDAPPMGMTADFFVEVDKASEGVGDVVECNEDNNTSTVTDGQCPGID